MFRASGRVGICRNCSTDAPHTSRRPTLTAVLLPPDFLLHAQSSLKFSTTVEGQQHAQVKQKQRQWSWQSAARVTSCTVSMHLP